MEVRPQGNLVPLKDYAFIKRVDKIKIYIQAQKDWKQYSEGEKIKIEIEGNFLSLIKAVYQKLTVTARFSKITLEASTANLETRCGCTLFVLLFNILLENPACTVRKSSKSWKTNKTIFICMWYDYM